MPSEVLQGKTPLYRKPPSIDHLKVFGCLCYATNLVKNDMFGARARATVFLGHSSSQKGYKLLDLTNKQFFVSTDVVFKEHLFPFSQSEPAPTPFTPVTTPLHLPLSLGDAQDTDAMGIVVDTSNNDNVTHETPEDVDCISQEVQAADNTVDIENESRRSGRTLKPPLRHRVTEFPEASKNDRWVEVMKQEIKALEENNTWEIVDLPNGKNAIGSK
ncbi:uncharacterized protein LOC142170490 [Nicotiana tabacum]|uniref:Uncharacterized protein LOC142170490 n=1 Tax=Nicotiana tabacum TaxID=4097 RepID=A0AC58SU84_TOBAC